jgi:hypothetical protein
MLRFDDLRHLTSTRGLVAIAVVGLLVVRESNNERRKSRAPRVCRLLASLRLHRLLDLLPYGWSFTVKGISPCVVSTPAMVRTDQCSL